MTKREEKARKRVKYWQQKVRLLNACLADPEARKGGFAAVPRWRGEIDKLNPKLAAARAELRNAVAAREAAEQKQRYWANCVANAP